MTDSIKDTLAAAKAVLIANSGRLGDAPDPARIAFLALELDELTRLARDLVHVIPDRSKITATNAYLSMRQHLHERRVLHEAAPQP